MSAVPGSLFRRILFWAHLSCGIAAGLIILLMSATGVLLTYEHQMVDRAERSTWSTAAPGTPRLAADELAAKASALTEPGARFNLVVSADAAAPVVASAGRTTVARLDPYSGEAVPDGGADARAFFQKVEQLHRWMGGDSRGKAASLVDISNLLFLFIIASGIYLWLPAVWRWRTVSGLMLFKTKYINSKVRDFNWHHVFSFWMLIPLFLIALSGVVISYPWASNLVYAVYGEQAPQRGGPPGGGPAPGGGGPGGPPAARGEASAEVRAAAPMASLQQLLDAAIARAPDWQRITLPSAVTGERVDITVELKSTERRPPRHTFTMNTADASVMDPTLVQFAVQSPGQRARTWLRFVHTGEQYGIVGQTVAGIASLAACFLVYTGLALAWRRLIVPLYRRKS